jgi:hypothetical protein
VAYNYHTHFLSLLIKFDISLHIAVSLHPELNSSPVSDIKNKIDSAILFSKPDEDKACRALYV